MWTVAAYALRGLGDTLGSGANPQRLQIDGKPSGVPTYILKKLTMVASTRERYVKAD